MDRIDAQILHTLQTNGRITNSELAKRVGLSAPSVLERVRKLEESGVICGYAARVDAEAIGRGTTCFVALSLALHQQDSIDSFVDEIDGIPEILDCYHITGEEDYLLRVAVRDMKHYEELLLDRLTKIPGISKLKTMVVLSPIKSRSELEVDESVLNSGSGGNNRGRRRGQRPNRQGD